MRRIEQATYFLIFSGTALGIVLYPFLPDQIVSRWDIYDNPVSYVSKWLGLLGIPFASVCLLFLFRLIPKLDPYEDNIKQFKLIYEEFLFVLTAFFFYIHFVMIVWNSGIRFYVLQLIAPAFGVLLFYVGNIMTSTRRNYIVGITTPWSMHDEKLWKKTHIFAGSVFKTAGLLTCLGFVFYPFALYFILAPLVLAIIYTYIYSFTEYQALQIHNKKSHR